LTIPPYPAIGEEEDDGRSSGVPIFGYNPLVGDRHVHPMEVMIDKDDEPVTSGPHGLVLSVTARGESLESAQDGAYRKLDKIHVPQERYRNDLTETFRDIYNRLEGTGWLGSRVLAGPKTLLGWPGARLYQKARR
jgi:phosphoribosylamine---glycine ligase